MATAQHHADEHLHEEDDPDFTGLMYVGVVGTFLLVAIILLVFFLYRQVADLEVGTKATVEELGEVDKAIAEQQWRVDYDHRDAEGALTGIPVDHAAELLIEEQRGR